MRHTALLAVAIACLTACGSDATVAHPAAPLPTESVAPSRSLGSDVERDLATLRASTARFHRFAVADSAHYDFLFMNMCMVDQSPAKLGGMGYHYVNTQLLDGAVDVASPEAVLYEPGPNGQLNLVAVEYVIPKDAWPHDYPPELFGQKFTLNGFGLWALHVWAWKDNPSGIFADWNPNVSCANAALL